MRDFLIVHVQIFITRCDIFKKIRRSLCVRKILNKLAPEGSQGFKVLSTSFFYATFMKVYATVWPVCFPM